MGTYTESLKKKDLPDGEMTVRIFGKRQVLIARIGDAYYAVDSRCTHMGGDLSQGTLAGTIVTCPRHGTQFDLRDGSVVHWTDWPNWISKLGKLIKPERPIKTYPVKLEGDTVLVEMEL
jgi:3-phenylpropionate/trans-cinnamate dioxygenase ferredoxin component